VREFRLTIAAHEVEIKSDVEEDTMEDLIRRALDALESTKLDADAMKMGFEGGTGTSSIERER
jgi:hypothetical protein